MWFKKLNRRAKRDGPKGTGNALRSLKADLRKTARVTTSRRKWALAPSKYDLRLPSGKLVDGKEPARRRKRVAKEFLMTVPASRLTKNIRRRHGVKKRKPTKWAQAVRAWYSKHGNKIRAKRYLATLPKKDRHVGAVTKKWRNEIKALEK